MKESGFARAAGQSYAKAGRKIFRYMTKLEIAAIEAKNTGVVNLYAEGAFYKAYMQSAFILCTYFNFPFKVSVRPLKGLDGPLLSVGFPMASLEKWTAGAHVEVISDHCLQVHYPFLIDLGDYDAWRVSFSGQNYLASCESVRHPRLSDAYFPVYGLAYKMTREVTDLCSRLKRNYRYSLGEDLRSSMMAATVAITFASKPGQQANRCVEALGYVERAELCLRLLNELRELSDERYTPFIDMTDSIKKQLEKWAQAGQSSQKTAGVPVL